MWPGVTGVTTSVDVHGSLDLIFRLEPDTRNLAIITGTTEFERYWLGVVHDELSSRREQVNVFDLVGLSLDELMKRVSELPAHTAVLFQVTPKMSAQPVLGTYELVSYVSRRIPTYCVFPNYCLDRGGIGGWFPDLSEQNGKTADLVARIFSGEKPENIPVAHDSGARPVVDSRQLARWKIPESDLPAGTTVLFRPPTFWQQYRQSIIAAIGIALLSLLFLTLVRQRAKERKTVTRLKESEQRFRLMADSAPTLIWMKDSGGRITYLNEKAWDFVGVKPDVTENGDWHSFIHPDDLPGVLQITSAALQSREGFSREYRLRRHDGVYRKMFDVGAPRFHPDGTFAGFIGSVMDVSDQASATEALEKLSGRLLEAQERAQCNCAGIA